MSHTKHTSKRERTRKAAPMLGVAGCLWLLRAAHLREPVGQQRTWRRGTPRRVTKSLSVRRKSLTSAWRRSMSSTRRTPEHPKLAKNLPGGEAAGAVAGEAAEAAAGEAADARPEARKLV